MEELRELSRRVLKMGRGHIAHDFATFHLDSGMAEIILNWGGGGRDYKRAPQALTCRGSGDICKIIILCIFRLKLGRGGGGNFTTPRLCRPWYYGKISFRTVKAKTCYTWSYMYKLYEHPSLWCDCGVVTWPPTFVSQSTNKHKRLE